MYALCMALLYFVLRMASKVNEEAVEAKIHAKTLR